MVPGGAASTGRGGDFLGVLGWGRTGVYLGEQPLRSGAPLVHARLCRLCLPPPRAAEVATSCSQTEHSRVAA